MIEKIKKVVEGFLPRKKETVELPVEEPPTEKVTVRVERLGGFDDVERIVKLVKDGNVVFLKTKDIQKRDLGEFQNSLQKMKRICMQNNFDIVGTEEGYLIITPKFARIER